MMFESFKDNDWNTLAMEEHLSDMQYLLDLNLIKDLDNLFLKNLIKKYRLNLILNGIIIL